MASIISAGTTSGTALNMAGDTSGVLQLATNGSTTAITVDTSQNVGIGNSSPILYGINSSSRVISVTASSGNYSFMQLQGGSAGGGGAIDFGTDTIRHAEIASLSGSALAFYINSTNSGNTLTERMRLYSDGYLSVPQAYTGTTGSAANVHILSNGVFIRSTSSLKYKTDVQDAVHGLDKVMELRPVTYKGINDGDIVFGGLIAEEVHDAGLTEFVQYAEDGTPDALAYGNMVSLLTKAIQEQQTIIEYLKTDIAALKAKVGE
jgi:hypothetical protein